MKRMEIKTERTSKSHFNADIQEPEMYHVVMHNDDVTTMDFVVMVLQSIFHKPKKEAERLMMQIHNEGLAIVGTYHEDIAVSKATLAMSMAVHEGFPLIVTTEKA